ncbi:hypothetical protein [Vibrio sp. MA40-2]|uniref:hypothetical protein n=1 Tax=Vibrio sp. MA40-2 TaxID=3391828 RepID=UPI0039A72DD2
MMVCSKAKQSKAKQSKTKRSGVKKPFQVEEIWRIRTRLEIENGLMQLALLNSVWLMK